ncbi:MAG: hypothetical protein ACHQ53_01620, partial [Polyangiales bacterium]
MRAARNARVWLWTSLIVASACSSYDAMLIGPPRGHRDASADDGSVAKDATTDGSSHPIDAGGHTDAGRADSGADAGDAGSTCVPNPGNELCPMICPETCNGSDDDCDGQIDEDANAACGADHATTACQQGQCLIITCETGYRDCDHAAATGCEAALDRDSANCGACNHPCQGGTHVQLGCAKSLCVVLGCTDGYADCDSDP